MCLAGCKTLACREFLVLQSGSNAEADLSFPALSLNVLYRWDEGCPNGLLRLAASGMKQAQGDIGSHSQEK